MHVMGQDGLDAIARLIGLRPKICLNFAGFCKIFCLIQGKKA